MAKESCLYVRSIHGFLEELSRDVPTLPGGGSAVALLGALAASLEKFIVSINLKKSQYISDKNTSAEMTVLRRLERLKKECEELIDLDAQSYKKVIEAYKMNESGDEKTGKRKEAIEQAFKEATSVPYQLMKHSFEMLTYNNDIIDNAYEPILPDAGVAAEVAYACFWGAYWIARANLARINSRDFVLHNVERYNALMKEVEAMHGQIKTKLKNRLE